MSAKTGRAPRSTNGFALETNVNGDNHLVAWADVEQQRAAERVCATSSAVPAHVEPRLKQLMATACDGPSPDSFRSRAPAASTPSSGVRVSTLKGIVYVKRAETSASEDQQTLNTIVAGRWKLGGISVPFHRRICDIDLLTQRLDQRWQDPRKHIVGTGEMRNTTRSAVSPAASMPDLDQDIG
jgi:hypothetical protein